MSATGRDAATVVGGAAGRVVVAAWAWAWRWAAAAAAAAAWAWRSFSAAASPARRAVKRSVGLRPSSKTHQEISP